MPAIRRSNCMILGAGHPPFVFASKRPTAVLRKFDSRSLKRSPSSVRVVCAADTNRAGGPPCEGAMVCLLSGASNPGPSLACRELSPRSSAIR